MKKFFTLLCMALLSAVGFAQDAYDPSEHTAFVSGTANMCATNEKGEGWQSTDAMTFNTATQMWEITLPVKDTKVVEFKIVYDGNWYGVSGGEANYKFLVTEPSDVTIIFNHNTFDATYSGDKVKEYDPNDIQFVVAAGSASLLNGKDWNVEAEENKLTALDDGYYQLELKNIAAGSYDFKFAANGAWATQWGAKADQGTLENNVAVPAETNNGGNFKITLEKGAIYDVTLTLDIMDPDNPMVTAAWKSAGDAPVEPDVYSLAGTFNGWNQTDESTEMTEVGAGIYSFTISLPAGEHKFKVVKNHDWAVAYPAEDYVLNLEQDADVTITLDLNSDGVVTVSTAECSVYFVTVNVKSDKEALNLYACEGESWTNLTGAWPGAAMNKIEGGFTYSLKMTKGETLQLIFNGEGGQTSDIKLGVINHNCTLEYILNDDWSFQAGAGVQGIEAQKQNGAIYTVAGQRVSKPVRGLYIQNGKKFIVK